MFRRLFVVAVMASALVGCGREDPSMPPISPPLDVAAPPPDASVTASGLASKVLEPGDSNVRPTATSTVRVHYTGWTTDGQMFDSSIPRGEPTEFPLNGVIPGWTEGLQLMVVGEKRRFWIPGKLAYGDSHPNPNVPTGMLVFDIELLDVVR
jgi:FKBP-type peptidyl-prolyl cis-trans isomerase